MLSSMFAILQTYGDSLRLTDRVLLCLLAGHFIAHEMCSTLMPPPSCLSFDAPAEEATADANFLC